MRSRNELAEEIALAIIATGKVTDALRCVEDSYKTADYILARRAPLGDQPAASETPADPRRTVGAVVYDTADDGHRIPGDLIVVADGGGQKYLDDVGRKGFAGPDESDRFSRWATRAECERHGIPYVERDAKPASPAASETPAVKFKVGDRVRVKRLSFHEGVGVDWPTRTKGYKVGNEFDVAWASPDGDKVDRANGSGQYLFADEIELVPPASPPPASPATSERAKPLYDPLAIKIVDHLNECGYFDDDAENIAGAYSEVHHLMRVCANATPAPRDEAKYAKDLADEYVMGVATVGCREDGIARNAYVAGWLACARARDGGR